MAHRLTNKKDRKQSPLYWKIVEGVLRDADCRVRLELREIME